jgi:hypothetical protein
MKQASNPNFTTTSFYIFSLFLLSISLAITSGCREKAEKTKSDKEEVQQKKAEIKLKNEKMVVDAKQLLADATKSWSEYRFQEAVDLLDKAEKTDPGIKLETKLRYNKISDELVKNCRTWIENDGPDAYRIYSKKPNNDPLSFSKFCLDFVIGEDRTKDTTRADAEEIRDYWKRVSFARDTYLRAEALIGKYQRVEGVNLLKELSRGYRDSKWGLAAGERLIKLGENK